MRLFNFFNHDNNQPKFVFSHKAEELLRQEARHPERPLDIDSDWLETSVEEVRQHGYHRN